MSDHFGKLYIKGLNFENVEDIQANQMYSEPNQTSKFIIKVYQPLTIFAKRSILVVGVSLRLRKKNLKLFKKLFESKNSFR